MVISPLVVIIHIKDDVLSLPSTSPLPSPEILPHSTSLNLTQISRGPLTMSPPEPSLPTNRRASGGGPTTSYMRSTEDNPSPLDAGRRASLPGYLGMNAAEHRSTKWSGNLDLPAFSENGLGATIEGKDEADEESVHERIERELNELESVALLGVRFLRAEQGMRIREFFLSHRLSLSTDALCSASILICTSHAHHCKE